MAKITLQDKIEEIKDYFSNVEIRDSLYIVKIYYPDKWKGYNSPDGLINVTRGDDNSWFYYANVSDVELYDIFDLVKDTIVTNGENEKRAELMKAKMLELRDLFADISIPLASLQGLKFTLATEVKKPKRSYRKKTTKDKKETTKKETIKDKKEKNNTEKQEVVN